MDKPKKVKDMLKESIIGFIANMDASKAIAKGIFILPKSTIPCSNSKMKYQKRVPEGSFYFILKRVLLRLKTIAEAVICKV